MGTAADRLQGRARRVRRQVDAHGATRRRQEHPAGHVRDLEHGRGPAARCPGDARRGLGEQGAARRAEAVGDLLQLGRDEGPEPAGIGEDRLELGDLGLQPVPLLLELDAAEPREPAEAELQDVVGLQRREVEDVHEAGARLLGVVAAADDLDHLVDVEDRDQQPENEVQPLLPAGEPVARAARDHLEPVRHVDLQQLLQPERLRAAVDERDDVDAEAVLERRVSVQLLEHRLGVEARLDLDHEPQPVRPVREVGDVLDARELLVLDAVLDLLDDLLGADEVRQLGDDEPRLPRREALDGDARAGLEAAAAGEVRVLDARQADDRAARGEIRTRDERHEVVERGVRVVDEVTCGADDVDEVVRHHVRRHADRDAARAVDEQVREGRGEHGRLHELVVVVRYEVDDVLVEALDHRERGRGEPGLRVAGGCRTVVERSEVAVPVDERHPQRERLRHAHHRVVDGGVAVGVELAHHLARDAGRLHVAAVGAEAHLAHLVQDAALHGLEAVARVGQGPGVDDRVRVLEERVLHLGGDVDVLDPLGWLVVRGVRGGGTHGLSGSGSALRRSAS